MLVCSEMFSSWIRKVLIITKAQVSGSTLFGVWSLPGVHPVGC